jgi:hypothetical protein
LISSISFHALARLLPRWTGEAFLVIAGVWLLGAEVIRSNGETSDWVAAGNLGQQVIAQIAQADPAPDPNALHVVLDLPVAVGNGELFYTYPDRAIRRFSNLPFYALLGGHQIVRLSGKAEMVYLAKLLGQEDQWRASRRMPRLTCLDTQLWAASTPEAFLHSASKCGLDVLRVENGQVQRIGSDEFWAWYQKT